MVELRKRKEAPAAPVRPAKKKTGPKPKTTKGVVEEKVEQAVESVKEGVGKVKAAVTGGTTNGARTGTPKVGEVIDLDTFGGEVETNDGKKVTLKQLVEQSKAGVALFTYPKASTPGCTKQACIFRDGYSFLTSTGLSIYGLSGDGPKANTTFKTKQSLPYDLICNPSSSLIGAIGMQSKPAKSAKRGIFIVDKAGKVLACEQGGPQVTADVCKAVVDAMAKSDGGETTGAKGKEDKAAADVAGEVADTAAELDD